MRRLVAILASIALAFGLMPAAAWGEPAPMSSSMTVGVMSQERVERDFQDIDDVLLNPGKGWWHLGGDMIDWDYPVRIKDTASAEPRDAAEAEKEAFAGTDKWFVGVDTKAEGRPPTKWPDYSGILGLGYFRFSWADIEPVPGEYHWDIIERQIKPYADAGKRYAFGIAAASSVSAKASLTPEWVFDAGAKYVECTNVNQTGLARTSLVPVWDDPVYLEYHDKLVKALAEKYDGDPRIAFIDIRGYGNYGEQHLYRLSDDPSYLTTYTLDAETFERCYIEPYQNAFDKTLIVTPYGDERYLDVYKRAIANGMSIRRDGILGADSGLDANGNVRFWTDGWETALADDKQPTVFELALGSTYTALKKRFPEQWSTEHLTHSVEVGKPSYLLMFYDMYRDNKAYCDNLANRMGYWLRLRHAAYDASMVTGAACDVELTFANDGVASMFEPNVSRLALLDSEGNVASTCETGWNAFDWKAGTTNVAKVSARFDVSDPGTYQLAYGMFAAADDAKPTYLLGSEGRNGDGWYVLGEVDVRQPDASGDGDAGQGGGEGAGGGDGEGTGEGQGGSGSGADGEQGSGSGEDEHGSGQSGSGSGQGGSGSGDAAGGEQGAGGAEDGHGAGGGNENPPSPGAGQEPTGDNPPKPDEEAGSPVDGNEDGDQPGGGAQPGEPGDTGGGTQPGDSGDTGGGTQPGEQSGTDKPGDDEPASDPSDGGGQSAPNPVEPASPSKPSDTPSDNGSSSAPSSPSATASKPMRMRSVYCLLNPKNGELRYLASPAKASRLARGTWRFEKVAFMVPAKSKTPVYRLVNRKTGRSLYTTAQSKKGWKNRGRAFYALEKGGVKVYRLENAKTGAHVLAKGTSEVKRLKQLGWRAKAFAFRVAR